MAEVEDDAGTEHSACDEVASTPKTSRLNSAAPDFVPTGKLPHVSIDRTVSGLDEVKFSPANGVCTPSSTTCWYWDGHGWHFSPHIGKGASPCSSWGSPHSVLAPLTPQQGGPRSWPQQQASTDAGSSSDGGLASDGSLSSCGSIAPAPPLLYHPQQHPHSPFYWAHHHPHHYPAGPASPHGPAPVPPTAMQQLVQSQQCGFAPHGGQLLQVTYGHPAAAAARQQAHMPGHVPVYFGSPVQLGHGMLPQSLSPRSMDPGLMRSPFVTPQRPPIHHGGGGGAHGLPPLAMPVTPQQYSCGQPVSPGYGWQPGTPSQWQEPGQQRRSWQRQRPGAGTPVMAPRRPSRMGSTSLNSSLNSSLAGSQNTSPNSAPLTPPPATPAPATAPLQQMPAAGERLPLKEVQLLLPPEVACPPSPRSCSPMRKASGLTAADTAQITAVLTKADLLYDHEVPEQVADLRALLNPDSQEPINARQRRTLRRATERAAKALGMVQQSSSDTGDAGDSMQTGGGESGSKASRGVPNSSRHAAGPGLTIEVPVAT